MCCGSPAALHRDPKPTNMFDAIQRPSAGFFSVCVSLAEGLLGADGWAVDTCCAACRAQPRGASRSISQHLCFLCLSLCLSARAFTRRQKRRTSATEKSQYLSVDEMSECDGHPDPPARMAWPGDGGLGCVHSGSADWLSGVVFFIGFASVLVLRWSHRREA